MNIRKQNKPRDQSQPSPRSPRQLNLKDRQSPELILAFSGTIGCGMSLITDEAKKILGETGYDVQVVKISRIIHQSARELDIPIDENLSNKSFERYKVLQDIGNTLRAKYSTRVLAELAISQIAAHRASYSNPADGLKKIVPKRVAYVIHQLKHPDEVGLLREVYGNLFYLIGVFANESTRRTNLAREMTGKDAQYVMDRDREEDETHGQKLDKTLRLADLFIRNNRDSTTAVDRQIRRLLDLAHGRPAQTPTVEEFAMNAAYNAGLRSACLSNQVGASICDSTGCVISTGCNDVPKAGGGLYTPKDGPGDHRCYQWDKKICWNDYTKNDLKNSIADLLSSEDVAAILTEAKGDKRHEVAISPQAAQRIAELIRRRTRLKNLLEFSRAVHAEMDAIVSIARSGGGGLNGGSLFTTTFPCHNCARHIVAAGITKVYYIDPYEKSLALDLHSDAISDESKESNTSKVQFLHFEGISPRRYQQMFSTTRERKTSDGRIIEWRKQRAPKNQREYLDSYIELEARVLEDLESFGLSPEKLARITN